MPKPEIGFHVKEDAVPYRTRCAISAFSISALQLFPAPALSELT